MPCIPFSTKIGSGFICMPVNPPKLKCYVCGKPAVCLCDYRDMDVMYPSDIYGHKLRKEWVPRLEPCSRPMCPDHRKHIEPDEDYCEFHSSDFSILRSRRAEALHRKRCKERGIDLDEE